MSPLTSPMSLALRLGVVPNGWLVLLAMIVRGRRCYRQPAVDVDDGVVAQTTARRGLGTMGSMPTVADAIAPVLVSVTPPVMVSPLAVTRPVSVNAVPLKDLSVP